MCKHFENLILRTSELIGTGGEAEEEIQEAGRNLGFATKIRSRGGGRRAACKEEHGTEEAGQRYLLRPAVRAYRRGMPGSLRQAGQREPKEK